MKKVTRYVCKYCHTEHSSKKLCKACENYHTEIVSIKYCVWEQYKPLPKRIRVKFSNGNETFYERD